MFHATILNKLNSLFKKSNYTISCILITILFLTLLVHLNKEIRDLDIWLHIKTGEQIVLNKIIPLKDIFSFTMEGKEWINHEWMFQALSFVCYDKLGSDGLIYMQNAVFILIFFIIFFAGLRNRNFLFLSVSLYIFLLNSSYRFTVRPDMFSMLFLALFIIILSKKTNYLYAIPLLQILWTNFHGFFLLGPIVVLIFCICERKNKLWLVFILSLIATTINPQLIEGALYPIKTFLSISKDRFIFNFVQELKKPIILKTIFNLSEWPYYKALILISLFSFRFNQKKINFTMFLLWLVFLLFSLSAIRNISYFAIVAIMVTLHNVNQRISHDTNFANEKFSHRNYYYLGRVSIIFLFSFCMIKNAALNINCYYYDFEKYSLKSCLWGESRRNFPEKAVNFILKNKLPDRLFNDFNSGSYLIGRSYPSRKVFIDGRTEFYGNEFLKLYKKATDCDKDSLEGLINEYQIEGFLLTMAMSNFDEKLAKYLFESDIWKPVYFDEKAIIFIKDVPKNKSLIDEFYIDLKSWKPPSINLVKIGPKMIHPHENIMRAKALKEIGCFEAAIREAKEALIIKPNCIDAFEILGNCYLELNKYDAAFDNLRIALAFMPNNFGLRNKYALTLYKLGFFKEAETQLNNLIKSRPKDSENYHALALVYEKKNGLNKAEILISKACKLSNNKNFEYLQLWADILFKLGKYKNSLTVYKLAIEMQPNNPSIIESIKKIEKIL
jgi:tetratricopeptide (TPR) repeat protein